MVDCDDVPFDESAFRDFPAWWNWNVGLQDDVRGRELDLESELAPSPSKACLASPGPQHGVLTSAVALGGAEDLLQELPDGNGKRSECDGECGAC